MGKTSASVTLFEEIAFEFLRKEHFFHRLKIYQLQSELFITFQKMQIILVSMKIYLVIL
jgi:hypothetical protein